MPDYKQSKIYKIVSDKSKKVYVGSTTQKYLSDRLLQHMNCYRSYKRGKFHPVSVFNILCHKNPKIILLECYPCKSKLELEGRERYWVNKIKNTVNKKHKQKK